MGGFPAVVNAIAGIYSRAGLADREHLARLLQAAAPGAVAQDVWGAGACLIGEARYGLHATKSAVDPASGAVVVLDGRLYGATALARELGAPPGRSDAELVLLAYARWQDACLERLTGQFALGLWDPQAQRLLCACDRFAACQIFYAQTRHGFAFASTEEALLALPGVAPAPDEDAVAHLLVPALAREDRSSTWLAAVKVLEPGQSVSLTSGAAPVLDTYGELLEGNELSFRDHAEAQTAFADVITQAVRDHVEPDGAMGLLLSGGIDSAVVRAAAGRLRPPASLQTYSAVADDAASCVETQAIHSLARGAQTRWLRVPSFTGVTDLSELLSHTWSRVHPRDNSIQLVALLCSAAARGGTRLLLHGASGDVIQTVPTRYAAELLRAGELRRAWSECRSASVNDTYERGTSAARLLLANAWTAYAPSRLRAAAAKRRSLPLPNAGTINPAFAARLRIFQRLRDQREAAASSRMRPITHQSAMLEMIGQRQALTLGLTGARQIGKRFGVDMHDVWAHPGVIDFLVRLPLRFKVGGGWSKSLARHAFASDLSPDVVWRVGKEHLGWMFVRAAVQGSLDQLVAELRDWSVPASAYLDVRPAQEALHRLWRARRTQAAASYADELCVYDAAVLGRWLQRLGREQ